MQEIQVELPSGGIITLKGLSRWVPSSGGIRREDLARAREVTKGYSYWVGDGVPGFLLANTVAKALGGKAVLPKVEPLPEGAQA